jgi:MYXO-CTERM domain-containing protein
VIAEDCNQYKNYAFSCQTSFSAVSSAEDSSSSTMMITGAALLGVAAALALFVRRRRQIAAEGSEETQPQHGFEMMNDKSAVSA